MSKSSVASVKPKDSSFISFKASIICGRPCTVLPKDLFNFELASPKRRNIFFKALPAKDPDSPLLAKIISCADVSSKVKPADLAIGATNFIDCVNLSKFNAELVKEAPIISATLPACEASIPKALRTEPAVSAEEASDSPVPAARAKVPSCAAKISCDVKPNLANSS